MLCAEEAIVIIQDVDLTGNFILMVKEGKRKTFLYFLE